MDTHRTGDLQIDQDLDAQRHHWIAERVGWTVITLVILAALLGLFGSGWLSEASVGTPEGALRLEYSRFGRFLAPMTLRLHSGAGRYTRRQGVDSGLTETISKLLRYSAFSRRRTLSRPERIALTYVLRVSVRAGPQP